MVYVKIWGSQPPPSHFVGQLNHGVWYIRPGPEPKEENSSILHITYPNSERKSLGENHPGIVVCSHRGTSYLLLQVDRFPNISPRPEALMRVVVTRKYFEALYTNGDMGICQTIRLRDEGIFSYCQRRFAVNANTTVAFLAIRRCGLEWSTGLQHLHISRFSDCKKSLMYE